MQNTSLYSICSRKCNGSPSFSFNHYTYCLNHRFCRHHFVYSSPIPVCSCCVNANLSIYNVNSRHVNLCELRQSCLIQSRPCKGVIFIGLDRVVSRLSGWDVNKRYIVCRSRQGWGKGRYRCMVYEDNGDEFGFDDGVDDEAEVLLSLLSDEVNAECLDYRGRNGRRRKKVVVEERGNGAEECATCGNKKKAGSSILRTSANFDYESGVNNAKDVADRTGEENKEFMRRGHQMVSRKEEKNELLRGRSRKDEGNELLRDSSNKEREDILIKNHRSSATEEHREDLLRRGEHRQRLRKGGSGCSSYYSLYSMGEYESDKEIQEKQDGSEERLLSKHKKGSGRLGEIERDGKVVMHGGYQEEQRLVLKKGNRVEGGHWHKESEKKLTDVSFEETSFHKESDVHANVSRKASYKKYVGQNEKASSTVKFNGGRKKEHIHTSDEVVQKSGTINNFKQFKENSEAYGANLTYSSDSKTLHGQREGISTLGSSSLKETREEYYDKARVAKREEEYRKFSNHTQSSNPQKLDISQTSSSAITVETIEKDEEKDSRSSLSSVHDAKEKYYHRGQFSAQIGSRITSQQLTAEIDIQRATISQRQSEYSIQKQEGSSNSVYGSYHEAIKNIQSSEGVGKSDSKMILEKWTSPSLGDDRGSGKKDVDQWNRSNYDAVVTPKLSQPVARGAIHSGSTSGFVITEVGQHSSHETSQGNRSDERNGQQVGYISREVSLASADSEIQQEKQTPEMKINYDPNCEQQPVQEVVSGSPQSKEQNSKSKHFSRSSGSKDPSIEMWDVNEVSNEEHPGAEVLDRYSANSGITKRSGRSLWNVVSNIVRFSWRAHLTSQSQMSKSGGQSSPNQSTSSELGNKPDENIHKGTVSQDYKSFMIPQEEKVRPKIQGVSSSSSSVKDQIHSVEGKSPRLAEVAAQGTSSGCNFSFSGEGTSHKKSEGVVSDASMAAGSSQSPAIKLSRSPHVVREITASGKVDASGGGEVVQSELPVSTVVSEISHPEGKGEEQQSRKFRRTTQVTNDRFEEWEEAYRIEATQRKMDEMFMKEALLEARKAANSWEVPVGAVLVYDGKIIARGHNLVEELRDSTAHAEMICIREASNARRSWRLSETTLYVTLEPCAMCAGAILQARIDVVVWGAPNKLLGADGSWIRLFPIGEGDNNMNLSDKASPPVHPFHPNIQIRRNVLASECADSMQQFFHLRRKKDKKKEPPTSQQEPPAPPFTTPARRPILIHPSKLLTKIHDAFH